MLCAVTPPDLRSLGWFLPSDTFLSATGICPQHKVPTETESGWDLQDVNYWDKCQALTSPKVIQKSKADEVDPT